MWFLLPGRLIFKWLYFFISAWFLSVCLLIIRQLKEVLVTFIVTCLSVGTNWAWAVAQQLLNFWPIVTSNLSNCLYEQKATYKLKQLITMAPFWSVQKYICNTVCCLFLSFCLPLYIHLFILSIYVSINLSVCLTIYSSTYLQLDRDFSSNPRTPSNLELESS